MSTKRAAARALAKMGPSDSRVSKKLVLIAQTNVDPIIRGVAIEALLIGWPELRELDSLLEPARLSICPELRFLSISGKIHNKNQSDQDLEELFQLFSRGNELGYEWRDDVAEVLLKGWPKSTKIKEICLQSVANEMQYEIRLAKEIALRVLLEGYPQDEEVADFCVNQIKNESNPFLSLHDLDVWRWLSENFRDHPQLVTAVDEWIQKQKHKEPEISLASLMGRTPIAKTNLLSSLEQRFLHWPAAALLSGWGIKDKDVNDQLNKIAFTTIAKASRIGHLLPQIIEDKTICRKRLIDILRDPACDRSDFVLEGLRVLGEMHNDTEVVDIVLDKLRKNQIKDIDRNSIVSRLIADYSFDIHVRELAKKELFERAGNFSAVAAAYGDDDEIRQIILGFINPLPVHLRGIIANHLGEIAAEDAFVTSLLGKYDLEEEPNIKILASINYYKRLQESEQNITEALNYLSESIVCYGHDYEERRQAAYCGLVLLDRLDIMQNAQETIGRDRICAISIGDRFFPRTPLIRCILENWHKIKTFFGDEFFHRIDRSGHSPVSLWDTFCIFADEYLSPRAEAILFLENQAERLSGPNIFNFSWQSYA